MQSFSVVLLQSDSRIAQSLIVSLGDSFRSIHEVGSLSEMRTCIAKHRAAVAIVDMELASLADLEFLSRDFPEVRILCTHRLADEAMWTAALSAGAADICPSDDINGIRRAALRNAARTQSAVA